ncbi:hypothetical protein Q8A73_006381 [Channa argus]|nr:hypothetical protein Q8A73_006381 [Channa argus]
MRDRVRQKDGGNDDEGRRKVAQTQALAAPPPTRPYGMVAGGGGELQNLEEKAHPSSFVILTSPSIPSPPFCLTLFTREQVQCVLRQCADNPWLNYTQYCVRTKRTDAAGGPVFTIERAPWEFLAPPFKEPDSVMVLHRALTEFNFTCFLELQWCPGLQHRLSICH